MTQQKAELFAVQFSGNKHIGHYRSLTLSGSTRPRIINRCPSPSIGDGSSGQTMASNHRWPSISCRLASRPPRSYIRMPAEGFIYIDCIEKRKVHTQQVLWPCLSSCQTEDLCAEEVASNDRARHHQHHAHNRDELTCILCLSQVKKKQHAHQSQ